MMLVAPLMLLALYLLYREHEFYLEERRWEHRVRVEQSARTHREEQEQEKDARREELNQKSHDLAMTRPGQDLQSEATKTVLSLQEVQPAAKPGAILDQLDNEKFATSHGVWQFQVGSAQLEASMRTKLDTTNMPASVIKSLIDSVMYDDKVSMQSTDYKVDGRSGSGHLFSFKVRKETSGDQTSVALQVQVVSFDMKTVIDGYETKEEPVYEAVGVRQLRKKGACTVRASTGEHCRFPFVYDGQTYHECTLRGSISLWCAVSVDYNNRMHRWERCGDQKSCSEDEYETVIERRFNRMAVTKLPVFSHRALPEHVTQTALMNDLSMITSMEAQRVLSA